MTTHPHIKTLDVGRLSPDMQLTPERIAQLASEAARMKYDVAVITVGGIRVFIEPRPAGPKQEALGLIRAKGLTGNAAQPIRPELLHLTSNQ